MNLQPRTREIVGQKEFLRNSVGMEFKTAGATLDATAFTAGEYVPAGTAIYKDGTSGLFVPVAADTTAEAMTAACLTAHDVEVVEGANPIVGTLVAGHPLEEKCTGVTDAFKTATAGRLVFDI